MLHRAMNTDVEFPEHSIAMCCKTICCRENTRLENLGRDLPQHSTSQAQMQMA